MSEDKTYFIAIEANRFYVVNRQTGEALISTRSLIEARDLRDVCNRESVAKASQNYADRSPMINATVRESYRAAHVERVLEARRLTS